jgi:hypothetical protein
MALQIDPDRGVVYYGPDGTTLCYTGFSAGHIGFAGRWEYFEADGEVYRADSSNPIQSVEPFVRQGARWECSRSHFDTYRFLFQIEDPEAA